jgi:DNA-binding SARP family transcriptional activator
VAAGLEFGVLEPLLVDRDDEAVPIPAGRQRALLAARLRKALADRDHSRILTQPPGYAIGVGRGNVGRRHHVSHLIYDLS